ncbi:CidA/LrgA family protein [Bacillus alkalicellulosilyticus]|uniref:CidA/LrgA family protein n=1 Tax=Alkalihalobacterium alkalicellulosilyticum TaxID=1912214 RepID=UPI001FECBA55|nr:CidA/LrgA family protein [Bacillus alkalicellulosilyticus]
MKLLNIIIHIGILYLFFLIGSWIQQTVDLFIPGSIIGMLLLLILLFTNVIKENWIETGTEFLLRHMSLLFIPVTVGVVAYISLFTGKGVLLIVVTLVSTILVMGFSAFISQWISVRKEERHE